MNKYSSARSYFMVILTVYTLGLIACTSSTAIPAEGPVIISSLAPEHPDIYPVGNTRITCVAESRNGSKLTYQWVCNDGTIIGSGETITWEAPITYGDFHIMCTVTDDNGNKASRTTNVTVLVRDPTKCCR